MTGGLLLGLALLVGAEPAAKPKEPPAVVELMEDVGPEFLQLMVNDGGLDATKMSRDFRDFHAGVCGLRVTPHQRFASRLPNWNYAIAERPEQGQYRYIRFAWKRIGGDGIMIQLHNAQGSWNQRYLAGKAAASTQAWGPILNITDKVPTEWTVVTRDLFKDFGAMTITGMALTTMEGGTAGLFDHMYLGRTIEDLDRASASLFAKEPLAVALTGEKLDKAWQDLGGTDAKVAGPALRTLLAGRKESLSYLQSKLEKPGQQAVDGKRILKLIADLDAEEFKVREAASADLEKLGEAAIPFLQKNLLEATSAEVRRRVEVLLQKKGLEETALTPDQLRLIRAIRILEWSGSPESRSILEKLAKQNEHPDLAVDAKEALRRMPKTNHDSPK